MPAVVGQRYPSPENEAGVGGAPSGPAGGDLTGTYPDPTLGAVGTAGTYTKVTTDTKGRVTAGTTLSSGDLPSHTHESTDITPVGPLPDPATCEIFVDATDVGGAADGDPITTWPDQSPNGLDLSNAGGTARPTYREADSEDGLPYMEFDGSNDYFRRTGMTEYTGGELTLYIVLRAGVVNGANDGILALSKSGATDNGSSSRFLIARPSYARISVVRNTGQYEPNNSTASGASAYDGSFSWSVFAIRWKVVMGRQILTLMHNNRLANFDLGASPLAALSIVALFLGCRHQTGDGTTPDNFTRVDVRALAVKYSADTLLDMRDASRYLASVWGVPILD